MTVKINGTVDRSIGYPVSEIIASAEDLICWTNDVEQQKQALERAIEDQITFLPDKSTGKIAGLVRREGHGIGHITPLTADWLIAADTPILHLIELFAQKSDRIFLVLKSSQIIGLVAPSDLNKIPALASIYLLTAQFEAMLADLVRKMLNEDEKELEALLSPERVSNLRDEQAKAAANDIYLSLYYYLYLPHLKTLVAKHPGLRERLGFKSRSQVDEEMDFTELRNRVSHPTGLLIKSRADLESVNLACDRILRLSAKMNELIE